MYTSWRWPSWNVKEEYLCNKRGVPQSYLSVYCQFCYTLYSVISIADTYCFFVIKACTEQGRMIKMFLVNICLLITALTGYSLSHSLKWFGNPPPHYPLRTALQPITALLWWWCHEITLTPVPAWDSELRMESMTMQGACWWPRRVRHVTPASTILRKLASQQDVTHLSCEFKFGNIFHQMSASNIARWRHDLA